MQVKCAMLCSTTAQCLLFLTVYKGLYGTLYCSVHSHSYKMVCKLKQFVSVHIMKAYQGVMAQLHPFLTLAFGGGEWLAKCPRHTLRLQKWFLHRVQSSVSSFNFHYPLASLRLSSSCLRLLPPLPIPSNFHSIFLSITRFIRQFLCKMWPTQHPASLSFILRRILLSSLTMYYFFIFHTISPTDLLHPSPPSYFKTFQLFLIYFPRRPSFSTKCRILIVSPLNLTDSAIYWNRRVSRSQSQLAHFREDKNPLYTPGTQKILSHPTHSCTPEHNIYIQLWKG